MKFQKFSIFLILITLTLSVFGQVTNNFNEPVNFRKNYFKLNVTQLFMRELRFGYERALSKKHFIGAAFAFKPAFPDQRIYYNFWGTIKSPYLGANSNTLFLDYKYFLGQQKRRVITFLELKLMARYTEYKNKLVIDESGKGYASSLSSGFDKIYGMMTLFGIRTYLFPSKRGFFDFYTGLGYRNKHSNTQVKSDCRLSYGTCGHDFLHQTTDDSKPFVMTSEETPTFHLGFDVGFDF